MEGTLQPEYGSANHAQANQKLASSLTAVRWNLMNTSYIRRGHCTRRYRRKFSLSSLLGEILVTIPVGEIPGKDLLEYISRFRRRPYFRHSAHCN